MPKALLKVCAAGTVDNASVVVVNKRAGVAYFAYANSTGAYQCGVFFQNDSDCRKFTDHIGSGNYEYVGNPGTYIIYFGAGYQLVEKLQEVFEIEQVTP